MIQNNPLIISIIGLKNSEKCKKDGLIFLLGNKVDIEPQRKVQKYEAEKLVKEKNIIFFQEISAKIGKNLVNILVHATKKILIGDLKSNK